MTTNQIRVYTASKLRHAAMLRDLRLSTDGVYFTARWPVTALLESEKTKPASHWQQDNFDDIIRSDFVMLYAEEGDDLKGALVEIGVSLAHQKSVWVIGTHPSYSKWQFHPLVRRAKDIQTALREMQGRNANAV